MKAFFHTLKKELRQAGYVMVHPFNGFWELKRERRVPYYYVGIILAALIAVLTMSRQLTGFVVDMHDRTDFNFFFQVTGVLLPFGIWCLSNWCITTLVDGEGSLRDIAVTTAYALLPLILLNVVMLILSNIITIEEVVFYQIVNAVALLWSGFLLVIGIMTIHQFTLRKTIGTILIALLGMVIIVFLVMLFFTLLQNMVNFIRLMVTEIGLR